MLTSVFLRFAGLSPFLNLSVRDGVTLTLRVLGSSQSTVRASKISALCSSAAACMNHNPSNFDQITIQNDQEYVTFRVDVANPGYTEMLELELNSASMQSRRVFIPVALFTDPSAVNPITHILPTDNGQGAVKIDALTSFPLPKTVADVLTNFKSRSWDYFTNSAKDCVFGHRGMGITFKNYLKPGPDGKPTINPFIENTIPSFDAVASAGGDGFEFDVVLTKDLVPVIYHDFYVVVKGQAVSGSGHFVKIPIHDLTFADIRAMQLYHAGVLTAVDSRPDVDPEMFRIPSDIGFPKLEEMLVKTNPKLAFNLEVKYPQMKIDENECDGYHSRNIVADRILETMSNFAGDRPIVISTFDFDAASVFFAKQNIWPIAALTQGKTNKWARLADVRTQSTESTALFAGTSGMWGISGHAEDLVNDRSLLAYVRKTAGVHLMIWGDDVIDPAMAASLIPKDTEATANIIITDNTPGVVQAVKTCK